MCVRKSFSFWAKLDLLSNRSVEILLEKKGVLWPAKYGTLSREVDTGSTLCIGGVGISTLDVGGVGNEPFVRSIQLSSVFSLFVVFMGNF